MKTKQLGNTKLKVSEMGLGCMGMSELDGTPDESESLKTLQLALDLGVNFFDTADIYGMGANEALLAKAFKHQWNKIILATKFGVLRDPKNQQRGEVNGSAQYVKSACDASLKRLGIDVIDLYYVHHVDTNIPIEETIGAMADLVTVGKVRYLGLSEASLSTLQKAHQIYPITALQSEYSLWTRHPEKDIIPLCEKLNISFIAYSPLGQGFVTNKTDSLVSLEKQDRMGNPHVLDENFNKNSDLVEELAAQKKCTIMQLALAWVMAKSDRIIPIPDTKKCKYLDENIHATDIHLTSEEIVHLETIFKPEALVHSYQNLAR